MAKKSESELIVDWNDPESVEQLRASIVKFVQGDPFNSPPNVLARELCLLARYGASWPKMAERRWLSVIRDLIHLGRLTTDSDNLVGPAYVETAGPTESPVEQLQLTWGDE